MKTLATLVFALAASSCDATDVRWKPDLDLNRMIDQPRADALEASDFFPDGKVLQAPPEGTVQFRAPAVDDATAKGYVGDAYIERIPVPLSDSLLARGRDRYDVFCATCHGILGDGDSAVSRNMPSIPARSLHVERIRAYPVGRLFRVASEGYGLMHGYSAQLSVDDRWAVVAYVTALQKSQHYDGASLTTDERARMSGAAP